TYGWAQAGLTRIETTAGVSALGGRVGLFIQQLLTSVDDGSIDWGSYDNDGPDGVPNSGDDDGFVDVLAILHPGFGAECGGAGLEDRVWSHKWSLTDAWFSIPEDERPSEGVFTTQSTSASGGPIRIDDYTIQPLLSCDASSINEIGVLAHELGHGFGLPDLYCTTSGCASNGIGRWGLMGSGGWGCGSHDPARPCHLSAWSKAVLGWVEVETLLPDVDHGALSLEPVQSSGRVLRIDARDGSDEYFLLENRQALGFDEGVFAPGLLVWQIDPDFIAERWPFNSVNGRGDHLGVWLRQADGRLDLEGGVNRADAGDPFPGSTGTTAFHAGAAPASFTHDGGAAGVTLTEVADAGGGLVSFRSISGYRSVSVDVQGSGAPGLVLVDDEPLPAGGATYLRAPFQGVVLAAEAGESLGVGVRKPFLEWADDPGASRIRVLVTPRDEDAAVTAVYGSEEVQITAEVEGGILDVVPGAVVTTPGSPDLWVPLGEPISLRADPAPGFAFVDWTGQWRGRGNPFDLTPLAPVTVGAEFGITFLSLARALALDGTALPPALAGALDADGNDNGRYDVGDLRAYLRSGAGGSQ
ncbi:MAG: M6 family metalloprotease domain-containing protein, partial [Gemmatimonadetes bacterium]|nr:M6 family metalloprotease domain-containing protein [Gemmatimonadota bacterium]